MSFSRAWLPPDPNNRLWRMMQLARLQAKHPSYKLGQDTYSSGFVRYWAIAARLDVHPVVVISADLDELIRALDPCDQRTEQFSYPLE